MRRIIGFVTMFFLAVTVVFGKSQENIIDITFNKLGFNVPAAFLNKKIYIKSTRIEITYSTLFLLCATYHII